MIKGHLIRRILLGLNLVLLGVSFYMVFLYVPTEQTMGIIQRIFYFHVPVAWIALFAYFIVFIGSVLFLWKRNIVWDIVASSSAELGMVFTTAFLITGSIWAKPIWGVWWTWSPRLTSALVLWFIYVAYLIVRSYAGEEQRRARFSAIVGIVGFVDVPIVMLAITLWRTQHPGAVIFQGGLTPPMVLTLNICILTFTILYFLLLHLKITMKNDERKIEELKHLQGSA